MENSEYDIRQKQGTFFTILNFIIPDGNITDCISSVIDDVVKSQSIPEKNIVDIQFSKTKQDGQRFISGQIKYCNYDQQELEAMDQLEQIRFVLKFMGYEDENIKDISHKKYWTNSDELVWVVRLDDPNYNFDPDETFCERDYKKIVQSTIESALGYTVAINFI